MQRFLVIVLVVVLLAGGVGYVVLQHRCESRIERITAETHARLAQVREDQRRMVQDLGVDMGAMLAVLLADDLAAGNLALVEARLTPIVQGRRVAGVLVVDQEGKVLAATDLRYRGRTLDDEGTRRATAAREVTVSSEPPAPGQLEVDAPVVSGGQRIATVRLFLDLKG